MKKSSMLSALSSRNLRYSLFQIFNRKSYIKDLLISQAFPEILFQVKNLFLIPEYWESALGSILSSNAWVVGSDMPFFCRANKNGPHGSHHDIEGASGWQRSR